MLWKYLKSKMQNTPLQIVCEENFEMSYGEVISFADNFSGNLKGIKCCAILCGSEMAESLALLSCFAAGVTALPLSQRYGELHCNKIIDIVSPDAVITDADGQLNIIRLHNSEYIIPKTSPALIMCTSGTTGRPKGAMLTESNLLTNITDISAYFNIGENDTILISRPLYHCAVLTGEFLTSLVKGVKIRFYSGNFNPAIVLKMLEEYSITAFCGTPTLLSMMARFKRKPYDGKLAHICISGECMTAEIGKAIREAFPNADIYNIYGLTEACPRISYLPPELFSKYPEFVGVPLNSVKIKILLEDGSLAKPNQVGVLWVKGGNVMMGYYNNPEKTGEIIKDGWLCTGDLALVNSSGLLKIKGRVDDMIIKVGMNIYPQEIESALKIDNRVKEALILAENDERLGTQLVLNIVGDFSHTREVKELCMSCLPAYQVPTKINLLPELPKNGSGKIIRRHKNG